MFTKITVYSCFLVVLIYSYCIAMEKHDVEIILDSTEVVLGSSARMDLIFDDSAGMPAPEIPDVEGLKIPYLRSTDVISRTGGKASYRKRHTYLIIPERPGIFTIGPFDIVNGDNQHIFKETRISVISSLAGAGDPGQGLEKEERFVPEKNAFLLLTVSKDRLYVNEIFNITAAFCYRDPHIIDIKYPSLEHAGFSIGEFNTPRKSRQEIKGLAYHIITFNNSAFAIVQGDQEFGPARIAFNLKVQHPSSPVEALSDNRYRIIPQTRVSGKKDIMVLPIPEKGRPEGFKGAVGNFQMAIGLEPGSSVKAGEAIIVTMSISGSGNFNMVSAPRINENEDFIFYQPGITEETGSYKTFSQILIPRTGITGEIPVIEFSYFDPVKERFITLVEGPFPIEVSGIDKIQARPALESFHEEHAVDIRDEPVGEGIIYIKETPGIFKKTGSYLYKNKVFLYLHTLPVFLYLIILTGYKRYRRLKEDIGYARAKKAQAQAKKDIARSGSILLKREGEKFYSYIFVCMQEYFGNKFNLPPAGVTADIAEKNLRERGCSPHVIGQVRRFFDACYVARFTPYKYKEQEMLDMLAQARLIVHSCGRIR
jgi:hypothetical protein